MTTVEELSGSTAATMRGFEMTARVFSVDGSRHVDMSTTSIAGPGEGMGFTTRCVRRGLLLLLLPLLLLLLLPLRCRTTIKTLAR
jgi:hypothetical protein